MRVAIAVHPFPSPAGTRGVRTIIRARAARIGDQVPDSHKRDDARPSPEEAELRRVHTAAYRVARRNGLSEPDAEDIAQAATAVVWLNWNTVDSPLAYVATVAERAAWAIRGARQATPALGAADRTHIRDFAGDVVGGIYVTDLLASLPPQQARTIDLHYLRGLSIGEVAEHLGVTINTVKTHNRLALQRLRDLGGGDDG